MENEQLPQPEQQQAQTQDDLWNYHNMVQAVTPSRKKRTGTNLSPANKLKGKKKKARKVQRNSRKINRK